MGLTDLYNFILGRCFLKSGGTMDTGATIDFPNVSADKIQLSGTKGLGVSGGSLVLYTNVDLEVRDSAYGGSALGTVWHSGNDGSGSGLDADLLDGYTPAAAATAQTIVRRDASADISANAFRASDDVYCTDVNATTDVNCVTVRTTRATEAGEPGADTDVCMRVNDGASNQARFYTRTNFIAWLEAGGLGGGMDTVAHYTGSASTGVTQDVTITSVTTTQAFVVPACAMTSADSTTDGIHSFQLVNSTTVRIAKDSGYNGPYNFQVVSKS